MEALVPTFAFEGDHVLAFFEGRTIASGTDFDSVNQSATDYLEALGSERKEATKKTATHVISPNGVEGTIISRINTVWGEDITVRYANGEIRHLETSAGDPGAVQFIKKNVKTASHDNPIEELQAALVEDYAHDKRTLIARTNDLDMIAKTAAGLIVAGVSYADEHRLDSIRLAAAHEKLEIKEAIDHLDASDAEAYAPPAPFTMGVAEQADLGHGAGDSWLDATAQDMIEESEGQDFEKMLSEGPGMFVTDLETGALADTGITRDMAYAHVTAKTAGFVGEDVADYRQLFVARVEVARRAELASRKDTFKREATAKQDELVSGPDDQIFW